MLNIFSGLQLLTFFNVLECISAGFLILHVHPQTRKLQHIRFHSDKSSLNEHHRLRNRHLELDLKDNCNPAEQSEFFAPGTVWWRNNILTEKDYTAFDTIEYLEQDNRKIFDWRAGNIPKENWLELPCDIHRATFTYANTETAGCLEQADVAHVEVVTMPNDFPQESLDNMLENIAMPILKAMGRVPRCLFNDLEELWLMTGNESAGATSSSWFL